MNGLLLCILCLTLTQAHTPDEPAWQKQLGTLEYPKSPELSPTVKEGSVYLVDNRYFRAKLDDQYDKILQQHGLPLVGQLENSAWREIRKGSFANPKSPLVDPMYSSGDIYLDHTGQYFRAEVGGEVQNGFRDTSTWSSVSEKAGWMGLMRGEIGDRRLGDIMIPGTHDTGTEGIDEDSFLVDRNILFLFAMAFEPQIISNWSKTQDGTLGDQCRSGFRCFDMRIADMEEEDGSFRWWHGSTGHVIQMELQEVVDFLTEYPEEILIMDFGHFAKPGSAGSPTVPIPERRKDEIADILLDFLEPYLVSQSAVGNNPTMNEVLAADGNIILIMNDAYIRRKHEGFWTNVMAGSWSGRTNPEDLFLERSDRLKGFLANSPNSMSGISGCNTPNEKMILGGLLRKYGDNENITGIIEIILPELLEVDPDLISFEGMWYSLLDFARDGTNTAGMWVRPADLYTSGASVHYRGVNDMALYWLARPQKYKLNEIHVDDAVDSSTLVDTAILSARGGIPREVTVAFQGNARDGYYIWDDDNIQTIGGTDGLNCTMPSQARYRVMSSSFTINQEWVDLDYKTTASFREGEYPPDAIFELEVSGDGFDDWLHIYRDVIQHMIENNLDLYLRGTNLEEEPGGFAYTSYSYNLFGEACDVPPNGGYLTLVEW